jgi:hypothetical protein
VKDTQDVALLDQSLELAEGAVQDSITLHEKIAALEAQLVAKDAQILKLGADNQKVILEKVAATSRTFDDLQMTAALLRLETRGIINAETHEKIAAELKRDPNSVFSLLTKISESLLGATGDGAGVEKEATDLTKETDPDGWVAFAQGKQVAA